MYSLSEECLAPMEFSSALFITFLIPLQEIYKGTDIRNKQNSFSMPQQIKEFKDRLQWPSNIKTSFVGFILQRPLIGFHFPSCHLSVHDVDSLFPDILPLCEPGGTLKWPVKAISNAVFDNSEAI